MSDLITDTYCLAEQCAYGQWFDEMVRDRIVVGIRDIQLSEKLQMDLVDLTRKGYNCSPPARTSQEATSDSESRRNSHRISQQQRCRQQPYRQPQTARPTLSPPSAPTEPRSCSRCGRTPSHGRSQCPAKNAVCHLCQKRGHFKIVCRSSRKTVSEVIRIQYIVAIIGSDSRWLMKIVLNNETLELKIDRNKGLQKPWTTYIF